MGIGMEFDDGSRAAAERLSSLFGGPPVSLAPAPAQPAPAPTAAAPAASARPGGGVGLIYASTSPEVRRLDAPGVSVSPAGVAITSDAPGQPATLVIYDAKKVPLLRTRISEENVVVCDPIDDGVGDQVTIQVQSRGADHDANDLANDTWVVRLKSAVEAERFMMCFAGARMLGALCGAVPLDGVCSVQDVCCSREVDATGRSKTADAGDVVQCTVATWRGRSADALVAAVVAPDTSMERATVKFEAGSQHGILPAAIAPIAAEVVVGMRRGAKRLVLEARSASHIEAHLVTFERLKKRQLPAAAPTPPTPTLTPTPKAADPPAQEAPAATIADADAGAIDAATEVVGKGEAAPSSESDERARLVARMARLSAAQNPLAASMSVFGMPAPASIPAPAPAQAMRIEDPDAPKVVPSEQAKRNGTGEDRTQVTLEAAAETSAASVAKSHAGAHTHERALGKEDTDTHRGMVACHSKIGGDPAPVAVQGHGWVYIPSPEEAPPPPPAITADVGRVLEEVRMLRSEVSAALALRERGGEGRSGKDGEGEGEEEEEEKEGDLVARLVPALVDALEERGLWEEDMRAVIEAVVEAHK